MTPLFQSGHHWRGIGEPGRSPEQALIGVAADLARSCLRRAPWYALAMDQAILEREALRLPAHERALLADALLGSLDDEAVRQVESAWGQEAEARLAAYHRGEVTALEGPAVLHELRSRYAK